MSLGYHNKKTPHLTKKKTNLKHIKTEQTNKPNT